MANRSPAEAGTPNRLQDRIRSGPGPEPKKLEDGSVEYTLFDLTNPNSLTLDEDATALSARVVKL